jgi:hypothetical protein
MEKINRYDIFWSLEYFAMGNLGSMFSAKCVAYLEWLNGLPNELGTLKMYVENITKYIHFHK